MGAETIFDDNISVHAFDARFHIFKTVSADSFFIFLRIHANSVVLDANVEVVIDVDFDADIFGLCVLDDIVQAFLDRKEQIAPVVSAYGDFAK
jgi:hypothetical protein